MTILYLIQKEFKQFFRNWLLPLVCFLLPLALTNIVPRIATQEIKGLNFAVVDNDHSTTSCRIIQKIDASTYLSLVKFANTYDEAMESIASGDADLILEFPADFEKSMVRGESPTLMLSANATNGTKGSMAQIYITQIIQNYMREASPQPSPEGKGAQPTPVPSLKGGTPSPEGKGWGEASVRFLFNPRLDYKIYMIPAIFALMLILIVGFLPALNIVSEKERGTIEQINVTPVSKVEFIISKVVPYVCIGMVMVAEALLAAKGLYGIVPAGSIFNIYIVAIIFCALVSSLGLIVSNYSDTIQQAALTMFFFLVIFILMSGLLTPVTSMPEWAQAITRLNPMRYFIEAMRAIYVKGASLAQISWQMKHLLSMVAVCWVWAVISYRKSN